MRDTKRRGGDEKKKRKERRKESVIGVTVSLDSFLYSCTPLPTTCCIDGM